MEKELSELPLLADQLREWLMMALRSKSTEPARMELAMPIQFCIRQLAALLGQWGIRNSSLTPSQKREVRALEELASELWVWLEEAHGIEGIDQELTPTHCKEKFDGKFVIDKQTLQ